MTPAAALVPTGAGSAMIRSFERCFLADASRIGEMRRTTAAHLRAWGVQDAVRIDDVVLVVSELVANGIQHGRGPITLRVAHIDGRVRVEVTDARPVPAALRVAGDGDVSGRGLFIVEALTHAWGTSNNGTVTWALLDFDDAEEGA
ncbi:ATP-binding protein [Streptomyces pinistramenti]|uniref:ATP-binding protein n=1 Tax=Streptomyces pinistramenti TaxID=2884812 RepID=UPI001D089173|nr:ATP-binding protein [Streptomyces pinistramenti]MCB5911975.1 ATP-binding protein [Streptomyces pinistramenti]